MNARDVSITRTKNELRQMKIEVEQLKEGKEFQNDEKVMKNITISPKFKKKWIKKTSGKESAINPENEFFSKKNEAEDDRAKEQTELIKNNKNEESVINPENKVVAKKTEVEVEAGQLKKHAESSEKENSVVNPKNEVLAKKFQNQVEAGRLKVGANFQNNCEENVVLNAKNEMVVERKQIEVEGNRLEQENNPGITKKSVPFSNLKGRFTTEGDITWDERK